MLWNYWTIQEVQDELHKVDESLLDKLEALLEAIEGDDFDSTRFHQKSSLVKLIQAFAPSKVFRNSVYRRHCLDRLPPEELDELASLVDITEGTFIQKCDKLARKNWDDENFAKKFIEFFQLPEHFLDARQEKLPSHIDLLPPSPEQPANITSTFRLLKDFQSDVFFRASEELNIPKTRFIIQMPTGSGKTRTTMEIVTDKLNQDESCDDKSPPIVFWLANAEELCEQAFQCFIQTWQHVATKELKAVRCWGSHTVPSNYQKLMFIVGGFQKLSKFLTSDPESFKLLKKRVRLLVIDEAHQSVAPTYKAVIEGLTDANTQIIGLTATPGRTLIDESQELANFYFSKLFGISNTQNNLETIQYLKRKKVLSRVDYDPLMTGQSYQLTAAQKRHLEKALDFPEKFLETLGDDEIRNAEIIKKLIKYTGKYKSILFFGCSVKHSKFISGLLLYYEVPSAHIDGSTNSSRRNEILNEFKSGKISVLCNYGVLSTGFDAPNTDVVFISRPTKSVVLYSQMIGRGLRGPAVGGTEQCKIVDVRDEIQGLDINQLYSYFDDYWL